MRHSHHSPLSSFSPQRSTLTKDVIQKAGGICSACYLPIDVETDGEPPLCRACAKVVPVAEVLNESGLFMSEQHYDLVVKSLAALKQDPAAFDVIRRYAALLNIDVAVVLFIDPEHQACIDKTL